MIRKPDAGEFRERAAVSALRDAGVVAVEGSRGIVQGTAQFVGRGLMLLFGLGFILSIIGHLGPFGLLLAFAGIFAFVASRRRKRDATRQARWKNASPRGSRRLPIEAESYDLSVSAVSRAAALIAVPAILFFPTTIRLTYMLPFALAGITYLALAMLILFRLVGNRTVLCIDSETLTVSGLFGDATILWDDVEDVAVQKVSLFNLKVLFTSGARRNLVVFGRRNRLGGSETLYVPVDMLGLNAPAVTKLVARFLSLSEGGSAVTLDSVPLDRHVHESRQKMESAFDADAVMARYLSERAVPPPHIMPEISRQRPVFGRKTTA